MKQLKFMLAAATAISLATAAQADGVKETKLIDNENFDAVVLEDGQYARDLPGYSYSDPTNLADDESTVTDAGYSAKSLKVNTGTNPLLRAIDAAGATARPVALTAAKSLYIDTMVQFTVTPNGDTVTAGGEDKLMIYLKEDLSDAENPVTNLVVIAAGEDENGEIVATPYVVPAATLEVQPNAWYNLKVETAMLAYEGSANFYPAFKIYLAAAGSTTLVNIGCPAESLTPFADLDPNQEYFPSLALVGAPDGLKEASLTYVGFAGEGMIDNLTVATLEPQTSVDFTFAWSTDRISAVKYAIGDATEYTTLGNDKTIADLDPEATIKIQIEPADWYAVKEGADLEYTASEESADLNDLVVAVTTKEDGDNVVVKPNTSATEVGITAPVFADADATQLGNVLTWAKKGSVTIEQINSMSFTKTGDPAGATPEAKVVEEAYLLGCSPAEVEAEKKAFVFPSFASDMTPAQMKAAIEADKSYNGTVVIEGATTLSDENGKPNWATGHDKPAFYRARLIFE